MLILALSKCSTLQKMTSLIDKQSDSTHAYFSTKDTTKVYVENEEWKSILAPQLYHIAREKGTEKPFSSPLESCYQQGIYYCAVCGNPLFKSDAKFDSGCGWPSFFEAIRKSSITYTPDHSHGMTRTEIQCGRCSSHLGHVFEDGPKPTGLRYCLNGISLHFIPTP